MSDSYKHAVVLVTVSAGAGDEAWFTNKDRDVTYLSLGYSSVGILDLDLADVTGDLGADETKIKNLPLDNPLMTLLAANAPFSKITVEVQEATLDDTEAVTGVRPVFKGLVYQVLPNQFQDTLDIIAKSHKYYLDITAGLPCTEQCSVAYFGDKNCGKTVLSESLTVASVSGNDLVTTASPAHSTGFLYNKGYVEKDNMRIKIKYHASGTTFQLSKPAPSSWVGTSLLFVSGCDRRLQTCRDVHSNESRFWGLGYNMVDYNAHYESP